MNKHWSYWEKMDEIFDLYKLDIYNHLLSISGDVIYLELLNDRELHFLWEFASFWGDLKIIMDE